MRVCGVELKGNDANICLLSKSDGLFDLPDCRARRLSLSDINSREKLQEFQFTFAKLMADYRVDRVVIRQRPPKGKFAGGAIGFKMEAALQLLSDIEVEILSPHEAKEILSKNPVPIVFEDTGLKAFQEVAFITAFASLSRPKTIW
ncbi:DUF3010 family protein [Aestuariirhabdus litorea]|uniref:DUF3010 family protein n=1 Tax=Aestuariirhabdus litorea TaxID=2528527 RepID=A0A3P3VP22_9GAMM|nr:DUF3010 family protein [Aestuariirhabdus litorea]RRJ84097.1 DUF3010 family protein [Aestuariirhabdus litorea]RWW97317.1 DUF3010 family protein [Endozoicomonadaceae bacterium GTF-13]